MLVKNEKETYIDKKLPTYIEDATRHEGKSHFCNVEAFPKHGLQNFSKVKGSVRIRP